MIPALLPAWNWLARMGAPLLAAFLIGQYVAGRNCEEDALRADNAALVATAALKDNLLKVAEERRIESVARLAADLTEYQRALEDAKRASPTFTACRAEPLAERLRIPAIPAG